MTAQISFLDASLAVLLAARIHGTDDGVLATAKRCTELLPPASKNTLNFLINSQSPLKMVGQLARLNGRQPGLAG